MAVSHHGVVTAAVADAAKSTWYAHGSIPTQTADCTARAEREGWIEITTRRDEAGSAHDRSRDDGLVQARVHADRHAARRGEAMPAVQHTVRLERGSLR
jgi:hypothetical protein